jgi:hypothetical protein
MALVAAFVMGAIFVLIAIVVGCVLWDTHVGWKEPKENVELHALRRRRELDEFKRQTKTDARRLRHELRQELRSIDGRDQ